MPTKKRARTERIDFQEELEMDEKRHLAQTLMDQEKKDGKGDIQKAVSLLNECMDLGDTEAMLMLAECYALGLGVDQSMERAEALIIRAEKNGSKEADALLGVINNGRCNGIINFSGLKTNFKIKQCFSRESFFFMTSDSSCQKISMKRIALLLGFIPCKEIILKGLYQLYLIITSGKDIK